MTLIILGILSQSCEKENPTASPEEIQVVDADHAKIVLGDSLDIPYTVDNMQTAFDNLIFNLKKNSKTSKLAKIFKDGDNIEIVPSHYYYRFLPKDSAEHNLLINDTVLQVSNIPLHLKVEQEGDYYDDPNYVGDENPDAPSYLYAVVPYDYAIPGNLQGERLDNYYFAPDVSKDAPEEGEIVVKQPVNKTTKDILTVDENGEVFEYLELEALKLPTIWMRMNWRCSGSTCPTIPLLPSTAMKRRPNWGTNKRISLWTLHLWRTYWNRKFWPTVAVGTPTEKLP
ncbi:hypothetical protein V1387_05770 [Allomuricauda taeanensis]|uniref:hypothetical protein n=1 Tax=Flagellimonas taeanensis TaxID=1005926 RepID=UPI002E7BBF4E|nr:hypothetical protein [Allomuricauda taeanensis]MEE1962183.1 hypothetical protein [Allomuricauda taeanensis]